MEDWVRQSVGYGCRKGLKPESPNQDEAGLVDRSTGPRARVGIVKSGRADEMVWSGWEGQSKVESL